MTKLLGLFLSLVFVAPAVAVPCAPFTARATPYIVGIGGGSASGKTTLARKLAAEFGSTDALVIHQDMYYDFSLQPSEHHVGGGPNYDHPTAMNFPLMRRQLAELRSGRRVLAPRFEYVTFRVTPEAIPLEPVRVIVFEGIHALIDPELRALMDLRVFVDVDADVRLSRRLRRDVEERGQNWSSVLDLYFLMARPMHDAFVQPSRAHAHVVLGDDDVSRWRETLFPTITRALTE